MSIQLILNISSADFISKQLKHCTLNLITTSLLYWWKFSLIDRVSCRSTNDHKPRISMHKTIQSHYYTTEVQSSSFPQAKTFCYYHKWLFS